MPEWLTELVKAGEISEEVAKSIAQKVSEYEKQVQEFKSKLEETQKTLEEVAKSKEKFEKEISALEEKIKKAKEEGKAELVKELEAERVEKQELMQKLKEHTVNAELNKALKEVGVTDEEIAALALKHFVDVDENGKVVFKNGEEAVDLVEGVKKFFENRPQYLSSKGNAGSGVTNQGGAGAVKRRSEMSVGEKAEFIAKNGREAYEQLPE